MLAIASGIALVLTGKVPQPQSPGLPMDGPTDTGIGNSGISSAETEAAVTPSAPFTQGNDPVAVAPEPTQAAERITVPFQPNQTVEGFTVPVRPTRTAEGAAIPVQPAQTADEVTVPVQPAQPAQPTEGVTISAQPTQAAAEITVPPKPAGSDKVETLKPRLEKYISEQKGRYGLYFKSLVTGQSIGIHDRDSYIAASTTKLPMNLLLYRRVAAGDIDLSRKLTYLQEDFEAGTGIIQSSPYGTEYTVRETARLSIVYSDNCGINMIIRLLGIENIRKYMQELGGTIYYGSGCPSCPYDLALYAEELYHFYQQEPDIAGLLVGDLQKTQWNDRINKLLPEDIKVAHKIGNYTGVCNDVGIVFASEPYVLAVMSDGVDAEAASGVIAQLSKIIYDEIGNIEH